MVALITVHQSFIPKGTAVAYSVYSMHRQPSLYGLDADDFRPERWEEPLGLNENALSSKWGYLPFNAGPRSCLGQDLALTEAAYVVVRLLRRYPFLKIPKGEVVEPIGVERQKMTLTLSIKDGCRADLGQVSNSRLN